jgi:nitrous oxidase accessory protein NosD
MRKLIIAACVLGLGIAVCSSTTASADTSGTIVVGPGNSIQAAVNRAHPGDTILIKRGVYHQSVQIRKNGITLRGSGASRRGTVIMPPKAFRKTTCNSLAGPTGICLLARKLGASGNVISPVRDDTVTNLMVTGFPGNGVFGFGTVGMTVTRVAAINNAAYGISRFESSNTLFARDVATGSGEAGFYVGDSPHADTVVWHDRAFGNLFGIFVRHARHVLVLDNRLSENCQGILVLDDGQPGGAGNTAIVENTAVRNNKFCPASEDSPPLKGGGIALVGATRSVVADNAVFGNRGSRFNSGGIVVVSAHPLDKGSNPNFDLVIHNRARRNRPADLRWDGTGIGVRFIANHCGTSTPSGLCH